MHSIVRLCRMCHGRPRSGLRGECWNCRPSHRTPYHPGPGYTLEARRASEYPVGTILVDVYFADRWEVMPPGRKPGVVARLRRVGAGFPQERVVEDYRGSRATSRQRKSVTRRPGVCQQATNRAGPRQSATSKGCCCDRLPNSLGTRPRALALGALETTAGRVGPAALGRGAGPVAAGSAEGCGMKPPQMARTWTAEEMALLAAGVAAGKGDGELSEDLGRSLNAVGGNR